MNQIEIIKRIWDLERLSLGYIPAECREAIENRIKELEKKLVYTGKS